MDDEQCIQFVNKKEYDDFKNILTGLEKKLISFNDKRKLICYDASISKLISLVSMENSEGAYNIFEDELDSEE